MKKFANYEEMLAGVNSETKKGFEFRTDENTSKNALNKQVNKLVGWAKDEKITLEMVQLLVNKLSDEIDAMTDGDDKNDAIKYRDRVKNEVLSIAKNPPPPKLTDDQAEKLMDFRVDGDTSSNSLNKQINNLKTAAENGDFTKETIATLIVTLENEIDAMDKDDENLEDAQKYLKKIKDEVQPLATTPALSEDELKALETWLPNGDTSRSMTTRQIDALAERATTGELTLTKVNKICDDLTEKIGKETNTDNKTTLEEYLKRIQAEVQPFAKDPIVALNGSSSNEVDDDDYTPPPKNGNRRGIAIAIVVTAAITLLATIGIMSMAMGSNSSGGNSSGESCSEFCITKSDQIKNLVNIFGLDKSTEKKLESLSPAQLQDIGYLLGQYSIVEKDAQGATKVINDFISG